MRCRDGAASDPLLGAVPQASTLPTSLAWRQLCSTTTGAPVSAEVQAARGEGAWMGVLPSLAAMEVLPSMNVKDMPQSMRFTDGAPQVLPKGQGSPLKGQIAAQYGVIF